MRAITKRQFDAYVYARQPLTQITTREVGWFEAADRKLLALIVRDEFDKDFGYIILGRDASKLFRTIDVCCEFYPSADQAYERLRSAIQPYLKDGRSDYPQGDERIAPQEIYELRVPEERVHPYFKVLRDERRFEAARNLVREAVYSFVDVDGNYIEQFQSAAFDARLWELYLYLYFYNSGFEIIKKYAAPDYYISRFGYDCTVEAVTVGPNPSFDAPNPRNGEEVMELSKDYVPIKFGSALFSKINRKKPYWEMEHVKGKPFILAVHDYHIPAGDQLPGSMTWTRAGLVNYLYGIRDEFDPENPGTRRIVRTETHTFNGKVIPSKFFAQPNSEHVSAVLFSNCATITTFNRMGKLAGLGSADVKMRRAGVKRNPDPEAAEPMMYFSIDIDDENYEEAWADGLVMFHNPRALHPVDPNAFPDISHVRIDLETGDYQGLHSPNEVFSSVTHSIVTKEKERSEEA